MGIAGLRSHPFLVAAEQEVGTGDQVGVEDQGMTAARDLGLAKEDGQAALEHGEGQRGEAAGRAVDVGPEEAGGEDDEAVGAEGAFVGGVAHLTAGRFGDALAKQEAE